MNKFTHNPKLEEAMQLHAFLSSQKQQLTNQFFQALKRDYNIAHVPSQLSRWWELTFPEFHAELEALQVRRGLCVLEDWREFFSLMREKAVKLEADIRVTEEDIQRLKNTFLA
ncbi:hypothetical protein V6R21_21170 [Limibacter armeniacum]|uniref:hypothetical protein n=1 Tax=Limibacter armeniacum TaxID=466084 RepID=UPI002FE5F723